MHINAGCTQSPVNCCLCLLHVCEDAPPHVAVEHDAQVVLTLQVAAQTLKPRPAQGGGQQTVLCQANEHVIVRKGIGGGGGGGTEKEEGEGAG